MQKQKTEVVVQQKAQDVLFGSVKTTKTNATRFLDYGLQQKYTRVKIAELVFEDLKTEGAGLNMKGKQIKLDNLKSQIGAFLNCIKTERKGWWSLYTLTEVEGIVKINKK